MLMTVSRRRLNSSEDEVIVLHPNTPTHEYDDFQIKCNMELEFELPKCNKWILWVSLQTNGCPAVLCKITLQEQVYQALLLIQVTADTIKWGQLHIFPSEDVSCAQSIIKDKPKEELVFGLTCRGPELEKNWMNQYVPSEMSICPGWWEDWSSPNIGPRIMFWRNG